MQKFLPIDLIARIEFWSNTALKLMRLRLADYERSDHFFATSPNPLPEYPTPEILFACCQTFNNLYYAYLSNPLE